MLKPLLTVICFTLCIFTSAQSPVYQKVTELKAVNNTFVKADFLSRKGTLSKNNKFENVLNKGTFFEAKKQKLNNLITSNPTTLEFTLEQPSGKKPIRLELVQVRLFADDFKISTNKTNIFPTQKKSIHFRGIISDQPNSAVALSIFEDNIISVIHSESDETLILGKTRNSDNEYILYNEKDLLQSPADIECGTVDVPLSEEQVEQMLNYQNTSSKVNNCVNVFLECDYTLASEKGGVEATADYISGLFNAVATLYQNEEITMKISEIMVWESEDPYAASTSADALDLFKANRTDFNGDLAHLISRGAPATGGIAWIGGLCSEYNYGYSYIQDFYNDLPDYSWSVNVIAHEIGHNLGSPHTHACTWNGNNTPLDGCGALLGYGEGCSGTIPTDGGTIMSYCHLISGVGVNFSKGFGQQPGDLIRSIVANATCLSSCDAAVSSCPTLQINIKNNNCFGGETGSAELEITNGVAPFQIKWSTGAETEKIENLPAGDYSLTVTDSNDCIEEKTFVITQTNKIEVSGIVKKESFTGTNDGEIILKIEGGTAPYQYLWSNGATESSIHGICEGLYSITITDAKNCTAIEEFEIFTEECNSVIADFPYNESFEEGFGIWNQSSTNHMNWRLHSGKTESDETGPNSGALGDNYIYLESSRNFFKTASLETGCIDFSNVTIPKFIFNYHMYGEKMGSLEVFVSENGGEFVSVWFASGNHGRTWQTALIELSAFAGKSIRLKIEGITGKDYTSDIAIDHLRIWEFDLPCEKPEFEIEKTDIRCHGQKTGTAIIKPLDPNSSFSYLWSTGDNGSQLKNLKSDTYHVTVTDENDCKTTSSFRITQPDPIKIAVEKNDASTTGALDGEIRLTASGGSSPYEFEWSTNARSESLPELSVGMYMVTVTDNNDCFATETIEIEEQFPGCMEVVSLPYSQGFENTDINWTQNSDDDFDWTIHSGRTSSSGTGPTNAEEGNKYAYIEASNNYYKSAVLTSPCFNLSGVLNPILKFSYHMYGNQMGTLSLEISEDGGENWKKNAWSKSGNHDSNWMTSEINLSEYKEKVIKIRFIGSVAGGLRSDMAIDAIYLGEKSEELPLSSLMNNNKIEAVNNLNVFPNPAGNATTLSFESIGNENIHVTIYTPSGEIVFKEIVISTFGNNSLPIDLSSFSTGIYFVEIQSKQNTLVSKFFKQD